MATFLGADAGPLATVPDHLRLTREQAVRMWTSTPAWFEGMDGRKGQLVPGAVGDLVVLDGDLLTVDVGELPSLTPLLTVVDGVVGHDAEHGLRGG